MITWTVLRRRLAEDRGAAAVESVVAFTAFLALTWLVLQAGLYYYARELALNAARAGVESARVQGATTTPAAAAQTSLTGNDATSTLRNARVSSSATGTTVSVTVTGDAPKLLGVDLSISQTATAPRERYTVPGQGARP